MLTVVLQTLATPKKTSLISLLMKHENYYYRLLQTGVSNLPNAQKRAKLRVNTAAALDRDCVRWKESGDDQLNVLDGNKSPIFVSIIWM